MDFTYKVYNTSFLSYFVGQTEWKELNGFWIELKRRKDNKNNKREYKRHIPIVEIEAEDEFEDLFVIFGMKAVLLLFVLFCSIY